MGCGGGSDAGAGSGPFLSYKKTGGIAGIDERLRCSEQRCRLSEGGQPDGGLALAPREVQRLRDLFERAGFEELGAAQGTPCADCFRYEIEYAGHVVRTEESAVPSGLGPVIAALDRLVSRARGGNT